MFMRVDSNILNYVFVSMNLKQYIIEAVICLRMSCLNRRSVASPMHLDACKSVSVTLQVKPGSVMEGGPSKSLGLYPNSVHLHLNLPCLVVTIADGQGVAICSQGKEGAELLRVGYAGQWGRGRSVAAHSGYQFIPVGRQATICRVAVPL